MSASMKKSRTVLRIIVALVIDIGATIIAVLVTLIPGLRDTVNDQSGSHLLLACVAALFICGTATLSVYGGVRVAAHYLDKGPQSMLGLKPTAKGCIWFLSMIIVATLVLAVSTIILKLCGVHGTPVQERSETWWVAIMFSFASGFLMQGIPEEIVWRGWFIPSLGNTKIAVALSVVVFALLHLLSNGGQENVAERFIYLLPSIGFAFAAAMARLASGSTWAAIGVHGGYHLSSLLLFFMSIEESPQKWVLVGSLWLLIGVTINWRYKVLENLA
jgi:hypothetical protein